MKRHRAMAASQIIRKFVFRIFAFGHLFPPSGSAQ
jgi:hypothetical protein